ncbi:MAG: hypothetical protein RI955_1499, partial [Bacteroidota bacterium]
MWCFGSHCGLDFNTNPPAIFTNSINAIEGCASISDKITGQLLFYTDGGSVWNKNHLLMPSVINGTLGGSTSTTQSAIIVPDPSSVSKYFIFTCDFQAHSKGLQYVKIDMSLNGGLGDIVSSPIQLITPISEKLTATINSNGYDYWIIVHQWNTASFYVYPLTNIGVGAPVISTIGSIHSMGGFNVNSIGYMKLSPNGKKIALAISILNIVEIFDFNQSTGIISNPISDNSYGTTLNVDLYGLSFSPNSNVLYVSQSNNQAIYQYNLASGINAAILSSKTKVDSLLGHISALQLAPDGKIYGAIYNSQQLIKISNPNLLGTACNLIHNAVTFPLSQTIKHGLPNVFENIFVNCNVRQICNGANYTIGSHTYTKSGNYRDTLISYLGLDSTVVTNLFVLPISNKNINIF